MNEKIIDTCSYGGTKMSIIEVQQLNGAKTGSMAKYLYYAEKQNVKMRYIKVELENSDVMTESGALYYSSGHVDCVVETGGAMGILTRGIRSKLTNEKMFTPIYRGTGKVVLEPTFGHFICLELKNESFIVDKGLYYCSCGDITVKAAMQSNVSSALAGGEGLFQTEIRGSGFVVLEIPVPPEELEVINLNNDRVQVDGNFALIRSGNIRFSTTTSSKGIIGTLTSGEGLLNTFEGVGTVYLAPTAPMYRKIMMGGIGDITNSTSSNNIQ